MTLKKANTESKDSIIPPKAPVGRPYYAFKACFTTFAGEKKDIHFWAKTQKLTREDVTKSFNDIGYNRDGTPLN